MPSIGYDLFHERLALLKQKKDAETEAASKPWVCEYSKRTFKSEAAYNHYLGSKEYKKAVEKHNNKLEKEKLSAEQEGKVSTKSSKNPENDEEEEEEERPRRKHQPKNASASVEDEDESEEESDAEEGGNAEEVTESAEGEENFGTPIPLRECLFSNAGRFKSVKASMNFMLEEYGFYLPFVEYLIDLEGLLEYLGAKIGFAHMCIYCHKRFRTTAAVQNHMRAMGHCMINLLGPDGKEDTDLMEFWYFGTELEYEEDEDADEDEEEEEEEEEEEDEGKDSAESATNTKGKGKGKGKTKTWVGKDPKLTAEDRALLREQQRARTLQILGKEVPAEVLARLSGERGKKSPAGGESSVSSNSMSLVAVPNETRRSPVEVNEAGELVMSDGTVYGTKALRQFYKKQSRPQPKISKIQQQLMSTYYALQMPGYAVEQRVAQRDKEMQNHHYMQRLEKFREGTGMKNNVLMKRWFRHQNPK